MMNFKKIIALIEILFIVPQTLLHAEPATNQLQGKNEYMNNCAVCHGAEGKGDGPFAEQLTKRPSNLTLLSKYNGGSFPETVIYQLIDGRRVTTSDEGDENYKVEPFHGPKDMPIWGDEFRNIEGDEVAVEDRISSLLEYLKSIQTK